jgi:hypothetical protein
MFPANAQQPVSTSILEASLRSNVIFVDRLITSKDHASVQLSIIDVDANGLALNTSTTFALCGQVRSQGESDDCINRLATKAGRELPPFFLFSIISSEASLLDLVLRNVWSYSK